MKDSQVSGILLLSCQWASNLVQSSAPWGKVGDASPMNLLLKEVLRLHIQKHCNGKLVKWVGDMKAEFLFWLAYGPEMYPRRSQSKKCQVPCHWEGTACRTSLSQCYLSLRAQLKSLLLSGSLWVPGVGLGTRVWDHEEEQTDDLEGQGILI